MEEREAQRERRRAAWRLLGRLIVAQRRVALTVITIAHRLSTAERADRVAVLDHGRLVELGTHDELVERGGYYAGLWRSWQRAGGEPVTA